MMKRKEFMLGAIAGLTFAAAATAGGVIDWPSANAGPVAGFTGRLSPDNGGAGLAFAPPQGAHALRSRGGHGAGGGGSLGNDVLPGSV